jgi:hypothetical protein
MTRSDAHYPNTCEPSSDVTGLLSQLVQLNLQCLERMDRTQRYLQQLGKNVEDLRKKVDDLLRLQPDLSFEEKRGNPRNNPSLRERSRPNYMSQNPAMYEPTRQSPMAYVHLFQKIPAGR